VERLKDWQKSCIGFIFLVAAIALGVFAWLGGWIGRDFRTGTILGIAAFMFFFVLAAYFFLKIRDWALLPAVAAGIYAVLPDIIFGPEDDFIALILGALLSLLLAWRRDRNQKSLPPSDEGTHKD
jgi:uncharacterized membrane protein (UPF0136 family)